MGESKDEVKSAAISRDDKKMQVTERESKNMVEEQENKLTPEKAWRNKRPKMRMQV